MSKGSQPAGHSCAGAPARSALHVLTPQEAANLLRVKPAWVYEAVRDGRLPHVKFGRQLRFIRLDLEHWVLGQRVEGRR